MYLSVCFIFPFLDELKGMPFDLTTNYIFFRICLVLKGMSFGLTTNHIFYLGFVSQFGGEYLFCTLAIHFVYLIS